MGKIIGVAIVTIVFGIIMAAQVSVYGFWQAVLGWAIALVLFGGIVLGIHLILRDS